MQQRILVTGCAGFIGADLCASLLQHGFAVRGIDDLSAGRSADVPAGVELCVHDIRDPAIEPWFGGIDVVFHLAARNCLLDCLRDPIAAADVNVRGTVQVLEACRKARVKKLVYASTSAVYEGVGALPSREDRVAPVSPYAASKHAGAGFVEAYGRLHDLRYTILRYFNVYGPRQDHRRTIPPVMTAFVRKLLAGEPPVIYGSGEKRRDFVHVDDVNRFHLQCVSDARTDGRVFNVGSGRNHSILEIYHAVVELLGSRLRPEHRPDLPGEASVTLADITAASAIGWEPRVSLQAGLAQTAAGIASSLAPLEPAQ